MYAATSLRDAYRKFRAKAPSYVYAFRQQAFFVFVMGDAIKVHELLSDVMIDDSPGYATIRVHSLGFYQLVYRLAATGQKMAMVATGRKGNAAPSHPREIGTARGVLQLPDSKSPSDFMDRCMTIAEISRCTQN